MPSTLGRIYRVAHRQVYGVVFIGLLVLGFLFIVGLYQKSLPWQHSTNVNLETPLIGNQLNLGGDVKMRGDFVGTIKSIKHSGDHATVVLALNNKKAKDVPDNV